MGSVVVPVFLLVFSLFVDSSKAASLGVQPLMQHFPAWTAEQETGDGAEMLLVLKLAINSIKTMTLCLLHHTVVVRGEDLKI